jgi:hypothetical protein
VLLKLPERKASLQIPDRDGVIGSRGCQHLFVLSEASAVISIPATKVFSMTPLSTFQILRLPD